MSMSISFLRKPWTKKPRKLSQPTPDVSFLGDENSKSCSPSLRHDTTKHDMHDSPSESFREYPSDHHPRPGIIHRSTSDLIMVPVSPRPQLSSTLSIPVLSGPSVLYDFHSQSEKPLTVAMNELDGTRQYIENPDSFTSFGQERRYGHSRSPSRQSERGPPLANQGGTDHPSESISPEHSSDEGACHDFTSDFSLSLFPAPPTLPTAVRKYLSPNPLISPQSPSTTRPPRPPRPSGPDVTPPSTPSTSSFTQGPQPCVTLISSKTSRDMGSSPTTNGVLPIASMNHGFQPRGPPSKIASLSHGLGLRLASSASNLQAATHRPATSHRTTSSESSSEQSPQSTFRQRALSRPEVLSRHSPLTSDAYMNPRPAPVPILQATVEQVEWGYAV